MVCDRGPGIPEPGRARLFEPFYRLPGLGEHAGGTGLGLSLCARLLRSIAERSGMCPRRRRRLFPSDAAARYFRRHLLAPRVSALQKRTPLILSFPGNSSWRACN